MYDTAQSVCTFDPFPAVRKQRLFLLHNHSPVQPKLLLLEYACKYFSTVLYLPKAATDNLDSSFLRIVAADVSYPVLLIEYLKSFLRLSVVYSLEFLPPVFHFHPREVVQFYPCKLPFGLPALQLIVFLFHHNCTLEFLHNPIFFEKYADHHFLHLPLKVQFYNNSQYQRSDLYYLIFPSGSSR